MISELPQESKDSKVFVAARLLPKILGLFSWSRQCRASRAVQAGRIYQVFACQAIAFKSQCNLGALELEVGRGVRQNIFVESMLYTYTSRLHNIYIYIYIHMHAYIHMVPLSQNLPFFSFELRFVPAHQKAQKLAFPTKQRQDVACVAF